VSITASDLKELKHVTTLARRFAEIKAPRLLEHDEPLGLEAEAAIEGLRQDLLASLEKVDPLIARLEAGPRV
jgi:hypothetical protein